MRLPNWSQDSHDYFTLLAEVEKNNIGCKEVEEVGKEGRGYSQYSQECKIIPAILAPGGELTQPGREPA